MADVIPFALHRRYQERSCPFPQRSADILFYTGVRYERATEARPQEAKPPSRQRPRKLVSRKATRRQPA